MSIHQTYGHYGNLQGGGIMDETSMAFGTPEFRRAVAVRAAARDEKPVQPVADSPIGESDEAATDESPTTPSRRRKNSGPSHEFTGSCTPVQFKIPTDLVQSLRLLAIDSGETMSELVLRCLTTSDAVQKCWITRGRKSA